jgi:hypothetical protein
LVAVALDSAPRAPPASATHRWPLQHRDLEELIMPYRLPPGSFIVSLFIAALLTAPAVARVKLITLPVRERVAVRLDNPQATLIEEERRVPLNQGTNRIDFSWANTRIDPRTILLRVIEPIPAEGQAQDQAMTVNVLSVSYPPNEKALVWDVASSAAGSARVRISYLLSGLSNSFNYRAIASHDESSLTFNQYMRVRNQSGEAYDNVRLTADLGQTFEKPIDTKQTRELRVRHVQDVPIEKTYTVDPDRFGYLDQAQNKLRVPMHYVITNDQAHQLGQRPLPRGKVRIFQKDAKGQNATTAFLGEDWGEHTPIDDQMDLALGLAQDVVVKRNLVSRDRQRIAQNMSQYEVVIEYEIENFKDAAITLDVREQIARIMKEAGIRTNQPASWQLGDQTTFEQGPDPEHSTQHQILMHADLPAREGDQAQTITHKLHLIFRNVLH